MHPSALTLLRESLIIVLNHIMVTSMAGVAPSQERRKHAPFDLANHNTIQHRLQLHEQQMNCSCREQATSRASVEVCGMKVNHSYVSRFSQKFHVGII